MEIKQKDSVLKNSNIRNVVRMEMKQHNLQTHVMKMEYIINETKRSINDICALELQTTTCSRNNLAYANNLVAAIHIINTERNRHQDLI